MNKAQPTIVPVGKVPDDVPWEILLAVGVETAFPELRCTVVRARGDKFEMQLTNRKRPSQGVMPAVRRRARAFMQGFMLAETGRHHV